MLPSRRRQSATAAWALALSGLIDNARSEQPSACLKALGYTDFNAEPVRRFLKHPKDPPCTRSHRAPTS
jgi:hypothetical protein